MDNFGVKKGYKARTNPKYFLDESGDTTWQPDVYSTAIAFARRVKAKYIVDIGSGNGLKLDAAEKEFSFVFIDFGKNLQIIRENMQTPNKHLYIDRNLESSFPRLDQKLLSKAVVICSDTIEHIVNVEKLVKGLGYCMTKAPLVIISTPDRFRRHGVNHFGPSPNLAHVREWSLEELDWCFRSLGIKYMLSGYTRSNDLENEKKTILQIGGTLITEIFTSDTSRQMLINKPTLAGNSTGEDLLYRYYFEQGLKTVDGKTDISLPMPGFLDSTMPNVSIKQILSHALSGPYSQIDLTLLGINSELRKFGDVASNYRQHGRLIEVIGTSTLKLNKKGSIYPFNILLVLPGSKKPAHNLKQHKYIDGGHLNDDYLLEGISGSFI